MNKRNELAAKEFVKDMIIVFCPDFRPSEDSIEYYERELSEYSLIPDQWKRVLNDLESRHHQRGLPLLGMIRTAIHDIQAPTRYEAASNCGKMRVSKGGYEFCAMIQHENARWIIADTIIRKNGDKVPAYRGAGMDIYAWLAMRTELELIAIEPDDPGKIYRGELVSAEEMAADNEEFRQRYPNAFPVGKKPMQPQMLKTPDRERGEYDDSQPYSKKTHTNGAENVYVYAPRQNNRSPGFTDGFPPPMDPGYYESLVEERHPAMR